MYGKFSSTQLEDGFSIIEPPAGLLVPINNRLKLFSDGEDKLTTAIWGAIFVLSCLYETVDSNPHPVVCTVASSLGHPEYTTIRSVYCDMPDDDFKKLVSEFIFNISRSTLETWFNVVDEGQYISKKVQETEKND